MMAASAMYPGLPTPPHATSSFPTTLRICRPAGDHSRLWLEEGLRPGTSYGDVRLVGRDGEIHYSSLVLAAVPALAKGLAGIDRCSMCVCNQVAVVLLRDFSISSIRALVSLLESGRADVAEGEDSAEFWNLVRELGMEEVLVPGLQITRRRVDLNSYRSQKSRQLPAAAAAATRVTAPGFEGTGGTQQHSSYDLTATTQGGRPLPLPPMTGVAGATGIRALTWKSTPTYSNTNSYSIEFLVPPGATPAETAAAAAAATKEVMAAAMGGPLPSTLEAANAAAETPTAPGGVTFSAGGPPLLPAPVATTAAITAKSTAGGMVAAMGGPPLLAPVATTAVATATSTAGGPLSSAPVAATARSGGGSAVSSAAVASLPSAPAGEAATTSGMVAAKDGPTVQKPLQEKEKEATTGKASEIKFTKAEKETERDLEAKWLELKRECRSSTGLNRSPSCSSTTTTNRAKDRWACPLCELGHAGRFATFAAVRHHLASHRCAREHVRRRRERELEGVGHRSLVRCREPGCGVRVRGAPALARHLAIMHGDLLEPVLEAVREKRKRAVYELVIP